MASLDLFASALGAFILISIIIFPLIADTSRSEPAEPVPLLAVAPPLEPIVCPVCPTFPTLPTPVACPAPSPPLPTPKPVIVPVPAAPPVAEPEPVACPVCPAVPAPVPCPEPDPNGQVVAGVEFTWASGDTAVAVVDASGLVTGVAAGQAEVLATAAGVTGRATLTVVAPTPAVVAVTPDTVVLTALEQTAQLTAEVRDQLGRVMEDEQVAWASSDTLVATIDSTGLVTAVANGTATGTATAGGSAAAGIGSATRSPAPPRR